MGGPALDGTDCDVDKWCFAAKCVNKNNEISDTQTLSDHKLSTFGPTSMFLLVVIAAAFILLCIYRKQNKWREEEKARIENYYLLELK